MFLSKFIQHNPLSFRTFSRAFLGARSFCTTGSDEKRTTERVILTENIVNEPEKNGSVSAKEEPKEQEVIEGDYYFVTMHPFGKRNIEEKWITFYLTTTEKKKYKLMGYVGWELLRAIRKNKLLHLLDDISFCDDGRNRCGSCHVRLDGDAFRSLPEMEEEEYEVVRRQLDYYPGSSKLACNIILQKCHDGAVIHLPKHLFRDYDEEIHLGTFY